jgi:hypothetical protein
LRSARHVTRSHGTFSSIVSVDSTHRQGDFSMSSNRHYIGARGGHRKTNMGEVRLLLGSKIKASARTPNNATILVSPTLESFQACIVFLLPLISHILSWKEAYHSRCPLWQTDSIGEQSLFHRFLTHRSFLPQVDHDLARICVCKKC